MSQNSKTTGHALLVSMLSQARVHKFELIPNDVERRETAQMLGFSAIRKLRFVGELRSVGKRDWELNATLGATIVQACVQTLEPVVTRIDAPVRRRFVAEPSPEWDTRGGENDEIEMPEDDTTEVLGTQIDPFAVMIEALVLAAPDYPRAPGAPSLDGFAVTEPGIAPLSDEDTKPFAGLAALKDQLSKGEKDG